ncbi:CD1375 family protein [Metabacillus idriensis]|nr:CD1375 family protein [Metabacillus idriensis]
MVKVYFDLIKKGLRSIEDVPMRWREDVQAMLAEDILPSL